MLSQQLSPDRCDPRSVLVVGGGVAGMHAALNLAAFGVPVLLVERAANLGGMVMRLDKVYPTDHCAFCPTWSTARECYDSPLIQVLLHSEVTGLKTNGEQPLAEIAMRTPAVNPTTCLFCGACRDTCPHNALLPCAPGRTWDPALPPVMHIDAKLCTRCGKCVSACPAEAINLNPEENVVSIPVADVIFATGFEEPRPGDSRHAPEFGTGSHPDILTAMEFEAWHNESRGEAVLRSRSAGTPVKRIAFIQCGGARDKRHLPYCAAVCCMHAMKQARWLKRRQPELDISLFYTDLRAPGTGQEQYMMAGASEGVRLLRSRPGLVMAAPNRGVAVRYEEPENGQAVGELFDMVVVNGGLGQCPLPGPYPSADGRPAEILKCGFCDEPVDVAGAVIQGTAAATAVLKRRSSQGGLL